MYLSQSKQFKKKQQLDKFTSVPLQAAKPQNVTRIGRAQLDGVFHTWTVPPYEALAGRSFAATNILSAFGVKTT